MPEPIGPNIIRVVNFHGEMREALTAYGDMLYQLRPPDNLSGIRRRAQSATLRYFDFVETQIYPWLLMHDDISLGERARAIISELGEYAGALQRHIKIWPDDKARAQWNVYRAASRSLYDRVVLRSDRELVDLYLPLMPNREVQSRPWLQRIWIRVIERRTANTP